MQTNPDHDSHSRRKGLFEMVGPHMSHQIRAVGNTDNMLALRLKILLRLLFRQPEVLWDSKGRGAQADEGRVS
jgi:hypothetical protein